MAPQDGNKRRLCEIVKIFEKKTTIKKQEALQIGRQLEMRKEDNTGSKTTLEGRHHHHVINVDKNIVEDSSKSDVNVDFGIVGQDIIDVRQTEKTSF